jgi:hypothetical protein
VKRPYAIIASLTILAVASVLSWSCWSCRPQPEPTRFSSMDEVHQSLDGKIAAEVRELLGEPESHAPNLLNEGEEDCWLYRDVFQAADNRFDLYIFFEEGKASRFQLIYRPN